jgi:hypothetical protein
LTLGLAAGVLGFIIKPAAGMFKFASDTSAQLRTSVMDKVDNPSFCKGCIFVYFLFQTTKLQLQRLRPPRSFTQPHTGLRLYNYDEVVGEELLARFRMGLFRPEGYVAHLNLKDMVLLLTGHRMVFFHQYEYSVKWEIHFADLVSVTRHSGDHAPGLVWLFYLSPTVGYKILRQSVDCHSESQAERLQKTLGRYADLA